MQMTRKRTSYWPGQADKPAILLMHSLGDSPNQVESLAESLQQEGYALYLPYYRSHQEGDLKMVLTAPLSTYLEDARSALSFLKKEGHQNVVAAGLSLGAFLALALACETDRVQAVISLSCPILTDLRQTRIPYFMRQKYYRSLEGVPTVADRDQAQELFEEFDQVLSGMNQWMDENFERLASLDQPVFIGHGQVDEVVSVQVAERLCRLLSTKGKPSLHIYPQANHYLEGDSVKNCLVQDICHFLASLSI